MKLRSLVFAEKLETYFILPHPNQEVKLISRVKMVNGPICQVQPANAQIDIITKPRIEKTDFLTHLRYATGLYGYTEKWKQTQKDRQASVGLHTWKSEALRVPLEESWYSHNSQTVHWRLLQDF